jgi:pSer/pThr/pTyr-binding forkhead associated (FHA) protein
MLKALSEYRKDPAAFLRLHEHPWLLWSPQRAPTSTSGNLDTPTRTVGTEMGTQRGPPGGRPLLFPICLKPGNPSERGVSIGRSSTSDITLTIDQVSRVHAYFTQIGEAWYLEDAKSRFGTRVNGMEAKPGVPLPLADGSTIALGGFELEFCRPAFFANP